VSESEYQFNGKNQQKSFAKQYDDYHPADPQHPYLVRKKWTGNDLPKQTPDGKLAVSLTSTSDEISGIQYIDAAGNKRYATGSVKKGSYYKFNGLTDKIFIVEGAATGASVSQATNRMTYVSFDAGNLSEVAEWVSRKHQSSKIIIACDNDLADGKKNVGVESGRKAADAVDGEISIPVHPDGIKVDFNEIHCQFGLDEVRRQISITTPVSTDRKFRLIHVGKLKLKPVDWIINGLLESDSLALIFGAPGTYKSFLAISIACSVSAGIPFGGKKVKQGSVIYIAGEGQNGLARRFYAWSIRNKIDLDSLPIAVSTTPIGLSDQEQVSWLIDEMHRAAKYYGDPSLIILDTLARNFGAGDENNTADMVRVVSACDTIRKEYNLTVLLIHHSGLTDKNRSRGSMALKAGLDSEYKLELVDDRIVTLEATKMKDGPYPELIAFKKSVVELGLVDDCGDETTSIVLDIIDNFDPDDKKNNEGKGKWQILAMGDLKSLLDEHKRNLAESGLTSTPRVLIKDWRSKCAINGLSDRRIWKKVKDSLLQQGEIQITGQYVTI